MNVKALFLLFCLGLTCLEAREQPNVIVIMSDDQGIADLSCYGGDIRTPHLDQMAKDGLKLDNFYVCASICTPSRFGLLTGQHPIRSKDQLLGALMFLAPEHKEMGIKKSEETLATALKQVGYTTTLLGKWHLGHGGVEHLPTSHGFDLFKGHTAGCVDFYTMRYGNTIDWYKNERKVDVVGYATDIITDDAVNYIHESDEKLFFMMVAYNAPHFGKGWNDKENKTVNTMQAHPDYLAKVQEVEDITRRKYAAKVIHMDEGIGMILKALKKKGIEKNTMVIFLSDHGGDPNYGGSNVPYRGNKASLFEGGLRSPCLIQWKGTVKAGHESMALTSSLDLFPFIAKQAGVRQSRTLDGIDISTLVLDGKSLPSRDLYWKIGAHKELGRKESFAYRRGAYKYIRDGEGLEYLFNIDEDPYEKKNLSRSHVETMASIKVKLKEVMN